MQVELHCPHCSHTFMPSSDTPAAEALDRMSDEGPWFALGDGETFEDRIFAALDVEGFLAVDAADGRVAGRVNDGRLAGHVDLDVVAGPGSAVEVPVARAAPQVVAGRAGPLDDHGSGAVLKGLQAGAETGPARRGRSPGGITQPGEMEKASGPGHGVRAFQEVRC